MKRHVLPILLAGAAVVVVVTGPSARLAAAAAAAPVEFPKQHGPGEPAPTAPPLGTRLPWPRLGGPRLVWTGFRQTVTGTEVVLQVSADVKIARRGGAGGSRRVVFVLPGCRALRPSDRLPFETRFFKSPVTRVAFRQRVRELEVHISLRRPLTATARSEPGPSGSWFWFLSFPDPAPASAIGVVGTARAS